MCAWRSCQHGSLSQCCQPNHCSLQGQAEVPVSEALSFVANQLWLLDVAHIVEIVKSVTSIRSGNK